MNFNESLIYLTCSFTNNEDNHLLKEPISLPCGHCICKKCIPKGDQKIECNKCGELIARNLDNDKESVTAKILIKTFIPNLIEEIEIKTTEFLSQFKNTFFNKNEIINLRFEFFKEEIDIRIESMKNELEIIRETFFKKLDQLKSDSAKDINIKTDYLDEINKSELKLNNLKKEIDSKLTMNEEKLYFYEDNLLKIKSMMRNFENNFFKNDITFTSSKIEISEKLVGEIIAKDQNFIDHKTIKEIMNKKNIEYIQLDINPYEIVLLPNHHLILTGFNTLAVLDNNFKQIKKIDSFDGKSIRPLGIGLSKNKYIYVTDYLNHCINKLDLNLNKIKSFGSNGIQNNQFKEPYFLYCKNDLIYVCDHSTFKIKILTLDLEYVDCIIVNREFLTIAVSDTTIGISGKNGTLFYDLNTKNLKKDYNNLKGRISEISKNFYLISTDNKVNCFDNNGELIDNFECDTLNGFITNLGWDGGLITDYNNNLFISSYSNKQIMKLCQFN